MASNTERQKAYNDYQISLGKQRLSTFISSAHKKQFDAIKQALGVTNEVCLQMLIEAYEIKTIAPAVSNEDVLEQLNQMRVRIEALESAGAVSEDNDAGFALNATKKQRHFFSDDDCLLIFNMVTAGAEKEAIEAAFIERHGSVSNSFKTNINKYFEKGEALYKAREQPEATQ